MKKNKKYYDSQKKEGGKQSGNRIKVIEKLFIIVEVVLISIDIKNIS